MAVPFTEIVTTTLRNRKKQIADGIFAQFPFFEYLNSKGHMQSEDGGEQIYLPIMFAKNPTVAFYDGNDVIDTSKTQTHTMSNWPWRFLAGTFQISGEEVTKNSGRHQFLRLIDIRQQNTTETMRDSLTTSFFAAQASIGTKDINSIQEIVQADPSVNPTRGALGGIDASNTFWRNKSNTDLPDSRTSTSTFAFLQFGREYMANQYNNCSRGPGQDHPNFILTTQAIYETYEAIIVDKLRYAQAAGKADFSFTGFQYKGAMMTYDEAAPSQAMYFLNTNWMWLFTHRNRNIQVGKMMEPVNQDVFVSKVLWAGNLVVNNRIRLGVINGFTT